MAKDNKDITLFDYEMNHVDGVTGEVTSKTATKVVKRDKYLTKINFKSILISIVS